MRNLIWLPLVIAGCTTEAETGKEHAILPDGSENGIVLGESCDKSRFAEGALVGRRADSIPFDDFPFPVRVVAPGMAMTMDFSPTRLTVETDADGVITRFSCG